MKCKLCSNKITKRNDAINCLNFDEMDRLLKFKKAQSVCIECRQDLLFANIISVY